MDNIPENSAPSPITEPEVTGTEKTKKPRKIPWKIIIIVAVVIIIGVLVYSFKNLFIAATVNGTPIGRLAVIAQLERSAGKSTLETLITKRLIADELAKKGLTISQQEIDDEIKKVEGQLQAQNLTLDQALAQQGMAMADFREQIFVQKELEKLLADEIQVSETEVDKYITDNEITIPAGQETIYKDQIKSQLQQQKLSEAAGQLVDTLRSQAKIKYYVNY